MSAATDEAAARLTTGVQIAANDLMIEPRALVEALKRAGIIDAVRRLTLSRVADTVTKRADTFGPSSPIRNELISLVTSLRNAESTPHYGRKY
jgi:hypothetical protein